MVVAFIPVRGGSKSIPLKNIKPFCGKPLVCWSIEALESCREVGEIIVATDSDQIESTVASRHYAKTRIYRRSARNACDTASTESVMLEYIDQANLRPDDVFMLVQATSPLTQSAHFAEALRMHGTGEYDSILTCVRSYRFFWNEDGTSHNYDYRSRPRRQDFGGTLMENGAFYISTVGNILRDKNRLSGRIGIYEMPGYTATEIDEPDDWHILEELMRRHVIGKPSTSTGESPAAGIKLFISDVDGTLTDAGMYYSQSGDELKKFNTRDGMGFQLLRERGVKTAIITSEDTRIVADRASKLKVDYLYQGWRDGGKLAVAQELCSQMGITMAQVAYIGDDLNCLDLLAAAGLSACPADAATPVKAVPGIEVMSLRGGEGCVREFIDRLLLP